MSDDRNRNTAGLPVDELTGRPTDRTGYQRPDPKDDHQQVYTTTPPGDRVGHADHREYQPVQAQDPKEITGQFDHLATRDPAQMDHDLQSPEFAGARTVEGIGVDGTAEVDLAAPMAAGLGVAGSMATAEETVLGDVDRNPGYTPPSEQGPPHVSEQPGDLPPSAPPELKAEVQGEDDR